MAETLLWSDDFAYANDAALEAAYPYPFNNTASSVSSSINVVTPGPPGYATGIDSKRVNIDYGGLFNVAQWQMAPDGSDFYGIFWDLGIRIDEPTALQLTVNGGTYPAPAYSSGYVTGLLT